MISSYIIGIMSNIYNILYIISYKELCYLPLTQIVEQYADDYLYATWILPSLKLLVLFLRLTPSGRQEMHV